MKLGEILHKLILNYVEQNRKMRHFKIKSSFFKEHPNIYLYLPIYVCMYVCICNRKQGYQDNTIIALSSEICLTDLKQQVHYT